MHRICTAVLPEQRLREQSLRRHSLKTAELFIPQKTEGIMSERLPEYRHFRMILSFFTENPKSVTGMYKVIGNAVPPVLAKRIGSAIIEQLGFQLIDRG